MANYDPNRDEHHHRLTRHRRYQIVITVGICVSTVIAIAAPHMSLQATMISLAVNFAWIWEA